MSVSCLLAMLVFGAGAPTPPPPVLAAPAVQKQAIAPEQRLCDLQMVNVDVATMLRTLSERTQVGLVLLSPGEAKVTTNLVRVTFLDALRHLCALAGLSYLKVGGTYVVADREKLSQAYPAEYRAAYPQANVEPVQPGQTEPLATRIYRSNYVSSQQLAEALKTIFNEEKLSVVAGPVQESPSISGGADGGVPEAGVSVGNVASSGGGKTLVLRGPKSVVEQALLLAGEMDSRRQQVAIEVTIHDVNDSALRDLGVSWNFGGFRIDESNVSGVNFGKFSRTGLDLSAVITALEQNNAAKLLASPTVSVLDGEQAYILIGDRVNFPRLVSYTQNNSPIFDVQTERVGIYLQVAASVSSDGQVTLSLYPQVSTVTGFLTVNGVSYPQISTREARTTLRVKSGETIAMGGLLRTDETRQLEKVPVLGDLPFLGELFRRRKTAKAASQVVITITPKVIGTDEPR